MDCEHAINPLNTQQIVKRNVQIIQDYTIDEMRTVWGALLKQRGN